MNILALDLATVTGWASWREGTLGFGTVRFGGDVGSALSRFQSWLRDEVRGGFVERPVYDQVIFESPWIGPNTSQIVARRLQGLAAVCEMEIYKIPGCECLEVNNSAVVKHFTGVGGGKSKAKKARTIDACQARGINPADDNEADAIAILDYAAHCLGVTTSIPDGALKMVAA